MLNETEFVQQIVHEGGDRDAASSLWKRLKDWGYENGFTPHPTDSLHWTFGIAEEEKDEDLILDILNELNVVVPNRETIHGFGPVETPLAVAKFVAFCRQQNTP